MNSRFCTCQSSSDAEKSTQNRPEKYVKHDVVVRGSIFLLFLISI